AFDARQKMADAALREAFREHPDYLSKWNNINNRLTTKNRTRNKIAHGSVVRRAQRGGKQDATFVPFFHSRIVENINPQTGRSYKQSNRQRPEYNCLINACTYGRYSRLMAKLLRRANLARRCHRARWV